MEMLATFGKLVSNLIQYKIKDRGFVNNGMNIKKCKHCNGTGLHSEKNVNEKPTSKELKEVTQKVINQYKRALDGLAKR